MCKVFPLFYKMRDVTTHSLQVYISLLRQLRAYEWISLSTEGADVCARPRRKASMPRRRHIIARSIASSCSRRRFGSGRGLHANVDKNKEEEKFVKGNGMKREKSDCKIRG